MTSGKIQLKCNELILWRDGHKAVVTLTINGRSVRILEADCREMFFETADADVLRESSRVDYTARRRRRKGNVVTLEAAE
jgi:hypothetical protein